MKTFVLFLSFLSALQTFGQERLSLGQNLHDYLRDHPPMYMTAGPKIINMAEGTIDFYKYRLKTTDSDIKILMVNKAYPIGILEKVDGKDKILLDMSGNGILDTDYPMLWVPYWVVADSTPERLKTRHNNVYKYFEGFYQAFQADENPMTSGVLKKHLDELVSLMANNNLENRDMVYALYCYYRLGPPFPKQCLAVLHYLTVNYYKRFEALHPLLQLHTLETLGRGTLAPWDPTNKLVVEGVYAYVRNPMISGVSFVVLGESVLLGSLWVFVWFVIVIIVNTIYFKLSEEPGLVKRFGKDYQEYRSNVPMWVPRLKAWRSYESPK